MLHDSTCTGTNSMYILYLANTNILILILTFPHYIITAESELPLPVAGDLALVSFDKSRCGSRVSQRLSSAAFPKSPAPAVLARLRSLPLDPHPSPQA